MLLADSETKVEYWRRHHNEGQSHSALDWKLPLKFARCSGRWTAASTDGEPEISTIERYGVGGRVNCGRRPRRSSGKSVSGVKVKA